MMKPLPIVAALAVAVSFQSTPSPTSKTTQTPLSAMIDQERAFAKLADEKGTRDAFLEFLAEESLLFTPGPTPGKLYYKNRPALPMKLSWTPEFADVSAGGDLGYTSGPWEIRKTAGEPPTTFGHFNTLWRMQKDGSWKVEVDLGVQHEKPAVSVADVKTVDSPKDNAPAPKDAKPLTDWQTELVELDTKLGARAGTDGAAKVIDEVAADTIRLFRPDNLPALGKAAAVKLVEKTGRQSWKPALARMSKSGDLGYTTGTVVMGAPATPPAPPSPSDGPSATGARPPAPATPHYYVRIWRRFQTGTWKIVLDVVN
jgi:ketosteroid isomerase-like protein